MQITYSRVVGVPRKVGLALAGISYLWALASPVHAFNLDTDQDWKVNFDNTILYNYGARAHGVNPLIGNNPVFAESDYRFPKAGDTVTDRVNLLSEFDATYQGRLGFRVSGAAWNDFAYSDMAQTNPSAFFPALPPNSLFPGYPGNPAVPYHSNYTNSQYSSYTNRFMVQGGELMDAFVFANFDLGDRPSTLRLGKLVQFWGNALFFGAAGINYGQSATDFIKQASVPGSQVKELALPRGQINFSTQVSDQLQLGAQYFLESAQDRLPPGGTYLGIVDFLFQGPNLMGVTGLPQLSSAVPKSANNNFGLEAKWSPNWLDGTLGFYYRRLDESFPQGPIFGANGYRLTYPTDVQLLGVSLDKQIGGVSTGVEMSYRKNTGLNTNGQIPSATDPNMNQGARGDTLNVIANAMSILNRTPLYDTGTALVEVAYVRKLKVTDQAARYEGVGTAACVVPAGASGRDSGCSTDNAVMIAAAFEPQWLQALPGIDLSAPMFAMYGLSGNAASDGFLVKQGDVAYTLGIKAVMYQRYNLTLQFNGYHGPTAGMTNSGAAAGLPIPNGTPGFPQYYAGGNDMYQYNDRDWVSLSFSTTF